MKKVVGLALAIVLGAILILINPPVSGGNNEGKCKRPSWEYLKAAEGHYYAAQQLYLHGQAIYEMVAATARFAAATAAIELYKACSKLERLDRPKKS